MIIDERRLQDLFEEMLESQGESQPGDFNASDASAEGLRKLLHLARTLEEMGQQPMPDAAASLMRARERVLQAIPVNVPQTSPRPQASVKTPFWQRWRLALAPAMAWAPAALVLVLSVVILMAVTVSVSAGAMPDSPFYPIKLTTENLILKMASEPQRAQIEAARNYHRLQEIKYARDRGVIVRVPYEGEVKGCEGYRCKIGPFIVAMDPLLAAKLQPGDSVQVMLQVLPDDSLMALSVRPGRTRTPQPAPTRLIAKKDAHILQPGETLASRPTDTPIVLKLPPAPKAAKKPVKPPTRKPASAKKKPTATHSAQQKRTSAPATTPQRPVMVSTAPPVSLPPAQRTLAPTPTPVPTATTLPRQPSHTPTPPTPLEPTKRKPQIGTATPVRRPLGDANEAKSKKDSVKAKKVVKGKIKRIYRARGRVVWVVIGRNRVYLTRNTVIDGKLKIGQLATAHTFVKKRRHYASKIVIGRATPAATPSTRSRPEKPKAPAPTPGQRDILPPVRRATPAP